jgi:hypothetical protein
LEEEDITSTMNKILEKLDTYYNWYNK